MRRREFLHGIGMGGSGDPGNQQLVLVPEGDDLIRVHRAVSAALRDDPQPIFALPESWMHLTLEYAWEPVAPRRWTASPHRRVAPVRSSTARIEATPWSLRLVPGNQAEIARVARAFGVDPPPGTVFCITLAYAADDVGAGAVDRLLARVDHELAQGRPATGPGLEFRRVERRLIRPDRPLCWELAERWDLTGIGPPRAVRLPATDATMPDGVAL